MATKKKTKRKAAPKRRKPSAKKSAHREIPLPVLKKRLVKLSRVVKQRDSARQTSMFG